MIGNRARIGLAVATLIALGALWWLLRPVGPVELRGTGDGLTIAATGDSVVLKPMPSPRSDHGLEGVENLLQGASLAVTNLEENLLDPVRIPRGDNPAEVRWPYGTKRTVQDLRRLGFTILSLANNHAIDYGAGGLSQTVQIIDHAGLLHAGTGEDLAQARSPVFLGKAPKRIAMIAVATSASAESRATASRGEIMGRPGVNALKYAPDVTVDASTFATLQQLPVASPAPKTSGNQLIVSGTPIKKGQRTSVDIIADERDTNEILAQIRLARADANVVVLTVHSHEPSNQSQAPAAFVQRFARAAIDAGASLVVGQGPHQVRGIETYKNGVIFYSLGNFAFDFSEVDPRSEDVYEAGIDLYRLALGAIADSDLPPRQALENRAWWESVIALARFEHGALRSVRLQPIDLGVDLPFSRRGTPRLAELERGKEILARLTALSREFGTRIRMENGEGVIDLPVR